MNEELKVIISASIDKFKSSVNEANQTVKGFGKDANNTMDKLNKTIANVGKTIIAAFSVREIVNFSKECFAAYNNQLQQETKLAEIMRTRQNATDAEIESIRAYASELQKSGVIGDEVALSGAQQLATYAKMPDTIYKLLPAMENYAAQQHGVNTTNQDMVNIANLFGKALQGNVGALKRMGITLTEEQEKILKYGTEEERAALLTQVFNDKVGDMNKTLAQTPEGKVQQLKNTLGDLQETLGAALAPVITEIASAVSRFFAEHEPQIQNFSQNVLPRIKEETEKVFNSIKKALDFVKEHKTLMETIAIIIGSITAAILIYNTYQTISTAITAAKAAADAAGAASLWAYAAAQAAAILPIVGVVAAISAVIAIIVLCIKHWDEIKAVVIKVTNSIAETVEKGVNAVKGFFEKIINFVKENWQGLLLLIVNPFAGAFKLAYDNCEGFRNKVDGFIEKVKSIIQSGFNIIKEKIINPIKEASNSVKDIFNNIVSTISNKMNNARDKVKTVIDKIKGFFNFTWSLPKLKMPHLKITGEFSISPPSVPKFSVDWYARGGVFDKPTLFTSGGRLGGLGEAGAEAIVPLENNTEWLDKIADRLSAKFGGGRNIVLQVDGKTFGQISVDSINALTKQTGNLPLVIV